MSVSAEWVSQTTPTYSLLADPTNYLDTTYNRRPGIFFKPFTLSISTIVRVATGDTPDTGIWTVPHDEYCFGNPKNVHLWGGFENKQPGFSRSGTVPINGSVCLASYGFSNEEEQDARMSRMWYRIYPYNGAVTPSAQSGVNVGGAGNVTFVTPQCKWPSYYTGVPLLYMYYGSYWPDILITYTTDGTEPSVPTYDTYQIRQTYNSSRRDTIASLPISDGYTYRVKVRLAVDNGYSDRKDVEYADYINEYVYYTQNAPTATPAAGTYPAPQSVALAGAKSGQVIRYTTDGSEPSSNSPAYSEPILAKNTTVKAQIYEGDIPMSPVGTYEYKLNMPAVMAAPDAGSYWNTQEVSLSCAGGYELYYTLDGAVPTKETGIKYTASLPVTETTKLRVQRYFDGEPVGDVTDFDYTINIPDVKADPSPGAVGQGTKIALSLTAGDAAKNDIYYTENDALPYDRWTRYTAPIEITKDTTLHAIARDKISGRYGEKTTFAYQYSELGYILNDLSFWDGSTKVTSTDIAALAGKTVTAKANITKIIPSVQGWLVTALYDPSGHAQQIKLDKLDQLAGTVSGTVSGKPIPLPADTTGYVLKTFLVHDFAQLRPVGSIVQIGEKME